MLRSWTVAAACALAWISAALPATASAQTLRYFEVWSYVENAPLDEIAAEALGHRDLGYWQLEFDAAGGVLRGTYHGSDGTPWLTYRYVEDHGRVFAELFVGTGVDTGSLARKSTPLETRTPRWSSD